MLHQWRPVNGSPIGSRWGVWGGTGIPGGKAEKLPIWEYGKDGTWLKCQKYWIAPDVKLEIWWSLIYIERLHHKIIEQGYFSSFCLGLLLEIFQHAITYVPIFGLFLDHSPNIRNIDKLVDFRLLSNSMFFTFWMSILQVPRLEILGLGWAGVVFLRSCWTLDFNLNISPGSQGSRPLKRIVPWNSCIL